MPNNLERELNAIHTTIAETKRLMENCVNVKHYELLQRNLDELEEYRLQLLEQMEVEL